MKYTPKYSNFTEMQYEIADELLQTQNSIEAIKDKVAEYLDGYVEAILKERVEEAKVSLFPTGRGCPLMVWFHAGDKVKPDGGAYEMFEREIPLDELLNGFSWWDEITEFEAVNVKRLAATVRAFADRLDQAVVQIETEQAAWDAADAPSAS